MKKNLFKKKLSNMPKPNVLIKKNMTLSYDIEVFKSVFHMKIIKFMLPAASSVLA